MTGSSPHSDPPEVPENPPDHPRTIRSVRLEHPPGLRARLDGRPALTATLLCGVAALVVGLASADWKVERGDTLYSIAHATGSTVEAIAAANDIPNPDLIYVGEEFVIPDGDGSSGGSSSSDDSATVSDGGSAAAPAVTTWRAGDTMEGVAARLDVSVEQLLRANGYDREPLMVGRRVRADAPPPPGGSTAPATHEVRSGETLEEIADRYGLSWPDLAAANDLVDPNVITTGTTLQLPGRRQGLVCPVDGAVEFANDFAVPKPGDRFHEGIDIFAERGTPVVAPVSGTVEHVRGTRGGLQYHLFGDDGYRYWGTHLDELGRQGRVEAGDQLGRVGTTGNAQGTSPHLHFEVYRDGISINAHPTLVKAC